MLTKIAALFGLAVVPVWVELNRTRYDEGPVVLRLTATHGLHRLDLIVLGLALLAWLYVVASLARACARRPGDGPRGDR